MKLDYKLIGTIAFVIIGIIVSIYFLSALRENKQASQVDPFSLVPADATSVLQINNLGEFLLLFNKNIPIDSSNKDLFSWYVVLNQMASPLTKEANLFFQFEESPTYVSFHEDGEIYYLKLSSGELPKWEKLLKDNKFFSPFSSIEQEYNGFKIKHYALIDNRFFSLIEKDGIFIGSFNHKLLQKMINNWNQGISILKNEKFKQVLKTGGKKSTATLFHYVQTGEIPFVSDTTQVDPIFFSGWTSSDVTFSGDEIWFSGYYNPDDESSLKNFAERRKMSLLFPSELIPAETSLIKGVSVKNTEESILSEVPVFSQFGDKLYVLYVNDSTREHTAKLYCFEINQQEAFEKELNVFLQKKYMYYSSKHKYIGDDFFKYTFLQKASALNDIAGFEFFPENTSCFFSIFNGYMFVADTEIQLDTYLQKIQQSSEKQLKKNFLLRENLNSPCNLYLEINIDQIVQSKLYSSLYLSGSMSQYPSFFSQWNVGIQMSIVKDDLLFYHLIFAKR